MATERREDSFREVRLEGVALVVVGGLLVGAIAGAFFAGRWVERRAAPLEEHAVATADPLGQIVPPADIEDTSRTRNYFDEIGGPKQAEPARQATPPREDPTPTVQPAATAEQATGDYYVQVAAVADPAAADALVLRLTADGYAAKLVAGDGALLRVRVGGYPSEETAREAVQRLRQGGHPDAFLAQAR